MSFQDITRKFWKLYRYNWKFLKVTLSTTKKFKIHTDVKENKIKIVNIDEKISKVWLDISKNFISYTS